MKKNNIKRIALIIVFVIFSIIPIALFIQYYRFYNDLDRIKKDFTNEELQYFYNIAYTNESNSFLKKKEKTRLKFWIKDISVKLNGDYTNEDSLELVRIIDELNVLINDISIRIVSRNNNADIFFIKPGEFEKYIKFSKGNRGYFGVIYNFHSYIVIDKYLSRSYKNHVLREELTQSLGLCNDTNDYPSSIFYNGFSDATEYSEIDKKLIQLLYNYNLPFYYSKRNFRRTFLSNSN